ncbi:kinase-like domain-containing protein [Fusarium tricinctum]|uniref:Kinase-like domain-containing protein n=1 Tax=Fusarium tricinctum TaxID=61284 RepID=A0A8K0SC61_9HYPO|nr:kinase-like domain-containing protein [Fusarium tricinctum]
MFAQDYRYDEHLRSSKALGEIQQSHLHQLPKQSECIKQAGSGGVSKDLLYRHKKALLAVKKVSESLPGDEEEPFQEATVISNVILRCPDNSIGIGQCDWGEDQIPIFITFYTEQGTVKDFLQKNHAVFLTQKRNFAIDIASGLHTLHASDIAHGDINLTNTLVFPHPSNDGSWMAKVSNFTCSIFGLSSKHQTLYSGASLYNAPEVRDRHSYIPADQVIQCESFSYGLLVWEILKNGESYFDPSWIGEGPDTKHASRQVDYLQSLPVDGLLFHASRFLCRRYRLPNSLDVHLFYHVLELTLRDIPSCRKDLATIALALDYCDRANIISNIKNISNTCVSNLDWVL